MEVMSTTAPSSPRHLHGYFFSAPTSPRRVAEFYRDYDDTSTHRLMSKSLFVPFDWEEKHGTDEINNPHDDHDDDDYDFAFDIGDRSKTTSLFAEELFDGGKIKPLKPPPGLRLDELDQSKNTSPLSSPRSPSSQGKNLLRKAFSPKKKSLDVDPFEAAIENSRNGSRRERGRVRGHELAYDSSRRAARSLSPYRVSAYPWEEEDQEQEQEQKQKQEKEESESWLNKKGSLSSIASSSLSSVSSKSSSSSSSSSSSRKWRLRDFLLFRSASEGREKQKYSNMKFPSFFKRHDDVKNSNSSSQSNNSSAKPRGSSVSPHEFHYIRKKAENKDMKKRTFLPYKQIGRFAF